MANLFDKSKAKATTEKVDKHEVVSIAETFEKDLTRMNVIDTKIAELNAERMTLDAGVREAGKDAMMNLYVSKNAFPGTLKVVAGKRSFQFITSDKYTKIDEDRAKELAKLYGSEVVDEKTVFSLNAALVIKHSQEISDLIMKSKKINADDKEKLIESKTTWTVSKGIVQKLRNTIFAKFKLNQIIEDLRPIFAIKAIKE